MGVKSVLRVEPVQLARSLVTGSDEQFRRNAYQEKIDLYYDNVYKVLRSRTGIIFQEQAIRNAIDSFIKLASYQNIYRRIIDEISRPLYSSPPVRRISSADADADSRAFFELSQETRLNEKMDLAARLVQAANHAWLFYRFVPRLGRVVLDVLTPNMTSVIPDPDDPMQPLAIIYDSVEGAGRNTRVMHNYWDDEICFRFTGEGVVPMQTGELIVNHGLGILPFVNIRRREGLYSFWDLSSGRDLEEAQVAVSLLSALVLRLHKTQGFRQLLIQGDIAGFPPGTILDEAGALVVGEGVSVTTLDLATSPQHYQGTIDQIIANTAANYGVSRSRLNRAGDQASDDSGLLERRAEAMRPFWRAEREAFSILKAISQIHPRWRIGQDAELEIDFSEATSGVDRLTQLKIRDEEERKGLRNVLDDILEDQPEKATLADAAEEYIQNLRIRAWRIQQERALNLPGDGTDGLSPEMNGIVGPMVRDGGMSPEMARMLSLASTPARMSAGAVAMGMDENKRETFVDPRDGSPL